MLAGAPGAAEAERDRRIELQATRLDRLAAGHAVAVLTVCETLERGIDAGQLDLAAPLELDRHRLILHRVHARQTADARLVELDRTAIVLMRRRGLRNLGAPRAQPRLDGGIVSLRIGHRENMGARPAFGHQRKGP
jgi:hypothetical protein